MREQGFFALCPNARNLIEWVGGGGFLAAGAMRANGKAVGFIP